MKSRRPSQGNRAGCIVLAGPARKHEQPTTLARPQTESHRFLCIGDLGAHPRISPRSARDKPKGGQRLAARQGPRSLVAQRALPARPRGEVSANECRGRRSRRVALQLIAARRVRMVPSAAGAGPAQGLARGCRPLSPSRPWPPPAPSRCIAAPHRFRAPGLTCKSAPEPPRAGPVEDRRGRRAFLAALSLPARSAPSPSRPKAEGLGRERRPRETNDYFVLAITPSVVVNWVLVVSVRLDPL
jgi:hypothetical protein